MIYLYTFTKPPTVNWHVSMFDIHLRKILWMNCPRLLFMKLFSFLKHILFSNKCLTWKSCYSWSLLRPKCDGQTRIKLYAQNRPFSQLNSRINMVKMIVNDYNLIYHVDWQIWLLANNLGEELTLRRMKSLVFLHVALIFWRFHLGCWVCNGNSRLSCV